MTDSPTDALSRRRCLILYFIFLLPVLLIAIQLVRYTIFSKEENRSASKRIAWRKGGFPVLRGRLSDRDGVLLAWTELQFDCVLTRLPRDPARRKILAEKIGCPVNGLKQNMVIKTAMTPDEISTEKEQMRQYPEMQIIPRFVRRTLPDEDLMVRTGSCRVNEDGTLSGISGWEKEYDEKLSGTPGEFYVMLDRHGNWLPETLKIIRSGVPGRDVVVNFSVKDLREGNRNEK